MELSIVAVLIKELRKVGLSDSQIVDIVLHIGNEINQRSEKEA